MGYFSNGTEGMDYESRYCDQCQHQDGPDGKSGCDVWLAHLVYNCDATKEQKEILDLLIPRGENGLGNLQCRMFAPRSKWTAPTPSVKGEG